MEAIVVQARLVVSAGSSIQPTNQHHPSLTEEDLHLTDTMAKDRALVRLLPVDGARASLEPHLQTNVLALSRGGFVGVLDVEVTVRLVFFSGRERTASYIFHDKQ